MKRRLLGLLLLTSCVTPPEKPASSPPVTAEAPAAATIKIQHSGKCLDISGGSRDDFAKVQQWECNGTAAQTFRLQDNDNDGWFAIVNTQSGKCLDAKAGAKAPGTPIIQYTCSGAVGWNQHFKRGPNNTLISRHSNLCLDVKDWSKNDGGEIQLWNCGNQANQNFAIVGGTTAPPANDWRLVWSDEFNGNGDIDRSKWNYEVWRPGTVNHELQAYTDNRRENVRVGNGILTIEARRDGYGGEFSSGRVKTQGKVSWTYGKVEARIKLPGGGKGSWPGFWMMPDNQSRGWPACGELDIMEWVSYDRGNVHATIHNGVYNWPKNTQKMGTTAVNPDDWHTYGMEWFPEYVAFFVDGREYHRFNNEHRGDDFWSYDKPFHIILNLAIGGDWGAATGMDYDFPRQLQVDYVRVYQK